MNQPIISDIVFKALSDNLHAAIDTGNREWADAILIAAEDATITKLQLAELERDHREAFEQE